MDCEQARDALEAFDSDELSGREAADVAAHLAACPRCQTEREELRDLTAELRHAAEATRPLEPFVVPTAQTARPPMRRGLVAVAAAAAIWAVVLTSAMLWPSLAARLTFLPVGRQLSSAAAPSPTSATSPSDTRFSLSALPDGAVSAAVSLFGLPLDTHAPAKAQISAELVRLLPTSLNLGDADVGLVALGPATSLQGGKVQLVATIEVKTGPSAAAQKHRYDLLITLARSGQGRWHVTEATVVAGPR